MKIGDEVPTILTVIREAAQVETVMIDGKPIEINNFRCNKFWARSQGQDAEILLCCDLGPESEHNQTKRKALVDLIKNF